MKVGILYGGRSAEHEVSCMSAKNVIKRLSGHELVLFEISQEGLWNGKQFLEMAHQLQGLDVVFPVLHGAFGEDGTIQGMLEIAGIPYVGAGVLGSAIGMDKDVTKRLLRDAGIRTANFWAYTEPPQFPGFPVFVKPATEGSSIGVRKAVTEKEFDEAVVEAFQYAKKIMVEEAILGREIECAVLGEFASLPGEIIPAGNMQSYEGKYFTSGGAQYILPVPMKEYLVEEMQALALRTLDVLCCNAMARVDFFLVGETFYVNEINTLPGFTDLSVYPRLMEASGINWAEEAIMLAIKQLIP